MRAVDDAKFLLLFILVGFTALVSRRYRFTPFVTLVLATCLFCLMLRTDLTWVARSFHGGFGQSLAAAGLTVLAGLLVAGLAQEAGAVARWHALASRTVRRAVEFGVTLVAGLGGTPVAALAVLQPVTALSAEPRTQTTLRQVACINAMQSSIVPAPLPIAAIAILGADWKIVLGFGLPLAIVQIAIGFLMVRKAPEGDLSIAPVAEPRPAQRTLWAYGLAILALLAMIVLNALGQIPSEPLGSGNTREQLIRLGLPLMLLVVGVGLALLPLGIPRIRHAFTAEGAIARIIASSAGLLLALGAAGGLQLVLHQDGFASLAVETVSELPVSLGVALPFLVAMVSRILQGSPLTATITAAGVIIPILPALGLDDPSGKALAVLAVTTGAISAPHIQDGYFWLACDRAGLRADQGLRWITATAIGQSIVALGCLFVLSLVAR